MLAVVYFVILMVVGYAGISWFAQLSGGASHTAFEAFFSAVRPIPLLVVTIANMFFALGMYYGFTITRFAIPAAISIGALTSFAFSVLFLGAQVSVVKIAGILVVLAGVILLTL
jgi:multidrug transporter EmrE-like cation transporter